MDTIKGILSDFVLAMGDNSTMKALKKYFMDYKGEKPLEIISFTSANKYSGAVFESGSYVLGAPEIVLGKDYDKYEERMETYSGKGYRLLIFGKYKEKLDGRKLTESVEPFALIILMNHIRKEAPATFCVFCKAGSRGESYFR